MHICVCYKKSIKTRFDFCSEMFQKLLTRNNVMDVQQLIDLFFCNLKSVTCKVRRNMNKIWNISQNPPLGTKSTLPPESQGRPLLKSGSGKSCFGNGQIQNPLFKKGLPSVGALCEWRKMRLLSQEGKLGLPVSDKNDHFLKNVTWGPNKAQGPVMMMMVMIDLLFLISLETMSHGDGSGSASCLPPFFTWPGISPSWSWWSCDGSQMKI